MNMPRTPAVASASNVAMAALTSVLPSNSVHNSKFPVFRSGWIFAADLRSLSSGDPSMTIRRSSGAKDMRPRFRPGEEAAQRNEHGGDDVLPDLHGCGVVGVEVDCWLRAARRFRGCLFNWREIDRLKKQHPHGATADLNRRMVMVMGLD